MPRNSRRHPHRQDHLLSALLSLVDPGDRLLVAALPLGIAGQAASLRAVGVGAALWALGHWLFRVAAATAPRSAARSRPVRLG